MSERFSFRAGQASIWAQPEGPNTRSLYLGCHEVGDITEPEGDLTPLYCPDPARTDKFVITDYVQGAPDLPSTEITFPVGKTLDYMEEWNCPGNILILKQSSGRRDLFTNWERAHILWHATRTSKTYSQMAARTPDNNEESMASVPLTFLSQTVLVRLAGRRLPTTETEDVLCLGFVEDERCADDTGPRVSRCQYGAAGAAAAAGAKANVLLTSDGGATWVAAAADPFNADEDISSVVYVQMSQSARRILVACGTTAAAAPAKAAYSDDGGATWTTVNVGATNAEFINGLFALDYVHIWALSNLGRIYFSDDSGATWTVQEGAVITVTGYLDMDAIDPDYAVAVGEANVIAYTSNGGSVWSAVTGPSVGDDLTSVAMATKARWFVGTDAGELWVTEDAGLTWTQKTFSGSGAGAVQAIRFENEMVGFMAHDTAAPVGRIFRTKDGGYSWEMEQLGSNDGVNALYVCGPNRAFVAGPVDGTTAYIAEIA